MPKGFNATTGRKSTITNLGCYVCPNCHRIFTTKSYKLMVRYKQLHSKKCKVVLDNKPPSIKKILARRLQNRKAYKGPTGGEF